jgi:hypothetical protein
MRMPSASTTKVWMLMTARPSALQKCGYSHACSSKLSRLAAGRSQRIELAISISTTFVTRIPPIFQCCTPTSVVIHVGPSDRR